MAVSISVLPLTVPPGKPPKTDGAGQIPLMTYNTPGKNNESIGYGPTKSKSVAIFQPFILQMEKPNLSSCTSKTVIEFGMDQYPKTMKGKSMPFPF